MKRLLLDDAIIKQFALQHGPGNDGIVDKVNVTLGFRQIIDELVQLSLPG